MTFVHTWTLAQFSKTSQVRWFAPVPSRRVAAIVGSRLPRFAKGPACRAGVTMVELVVCIAIIGILLSLLMMGIQAVRETARDAACTSNLRQIGLALTEYHAANNSFPYGSSPQGGLHVALLPYYEAPELAARIRAGEDFEDVAKIPLPLLLCPSDGASVQYSAQSPAGTNYSGNQGNWLVSHDYNGMFRPHNLKPYSNGVVRAADVTRGLSNTCAVSEVLRGEAYNFHRLRTLWFTPVGFASPQDLEDFCTMCRSIPPNATAYGWTGVSGGRGTPWSSASSGFALYNHVLTPNQPACINSHWVPGGIYPPTSHHRTKVNVAYADSHIQAIAETVDLGVWRSIGSRY